MNAPEGYVFTPGHEPSFWLREIVGRRMAEIRKTKLQNQATVVTYLSGNPTSPGTAEDRTCDRCRVYLPQGELIHPIMCQPEPAIMLIGGLCRACLELEVPGQVSAHV